MGRMIHIRCRWTRQECQAKRRNLALTPKAKVSTDRPPRQGSRSLHPVRTRFNAGDIAQVPCAQGPRPHGTGRFELLWSMFGAGGRRPDQHGKLPWLWPATGVSNRKNMDWAEQRKFAPPGSPERAERPRGASSIAIAATLSCVVRIGLIVISADFTGKPRVIARADKL